MTTDIPANTVLPAASIDVDSAIDSIRPSAYGMCSNISEAFVGRHNELSKLLLAYERIILERLGDDRKQDSKNVKLQMVDRPHRLRREITDSSSSSSSSSYRDSGKDRSLGTRTEIVTDSDNSNSSHSITSLSDDIRPSTDNSRLIPAVFISGASGTGKSKLIEQFLSHVKDPAKKPESRYASTREETASDVHILKGKLDEQTGPAGPYSALAQAVASFVDSLKNGPPEAGARFTTELHAAFADDDLEVLTRVLPALADLISSVDGNDGRRTSSKKLRSMQSVPDLPERIPSAAENQSAQNAGDTWQRVQYLFVQFFKVMTSSAIPSQRTTLSNGESSLNQRTGDGESSHDQKRTIILCLDDLQWASSATLELLTRILMDPSIRNFMLVGSTRDDSSAPSVDPGTKQYRGQRNSNPDVPTRESRGPFRSMKQTLDASPRFNKAMLYIRLDNLSLTDTNDWLSSLVEGPRSLVESVSSKIYSKTSGNPYHIQQILEVLQRKGSLELNKTTRKWTWVSNRTVGFDCDDTHSVSSLSIEDDIDDLVLLKLQSLPKQLQQLLTVASYICSQFEMNVLATIWNNMQSLVVMYDLDLECWGKAEPNASTGQSQSVESLLETGVLEGILTNTIGSDNYRFTHDRVQSAAYKVIPGGEYRARFRLNIGHCLLRLYRKLQSQSRVDGTRYAHDDELLFIAAAHLNDTSSKDHLFIAKLNLEIGEMALKKGALAAASDHLRLSYESFRKVRVRTKENVYDMSIRLYQARGNIEVVLGNYDVGRAMYNKVLSTAKTVEEKLLTYLALAKSYGRQDRHQEALDILNYVTTKLKIFPKRWYAFHIAKDWGSMRRFFRSRSDIDILGLPVQTDPVKMLSMDLLNELGVRAFYTKNLTIWFACLCKQIRMIAKDGICQHAAVPIASYGILCDLLSDHSNATRAALLARGILKVTNGKEVRGWVYFMTSAFVLSWSRPNRDTYAGLRQGYESAMKCGDFEVAFTNEYIKNMHMYTAGEPLPGIVDAMSRMLDQAKQYQVVFAERLGRHPCHLMKVMVGEHPINWDDVRNFGRDPEMTIDNIPMIAGYWIRLQLAVYFFRYEDAEELSERFADIAADDSVYSQLVSRLMFTGLAVAGRYRQTSQKKYLKRLRQTEETLRGLVYKRGLNSLHRSHILKAELKTATSSNASKVCRSYDVAIELAEQSGHIHDVALACELAGEALLRLNQESSVCDYFMRAVEYYHRWGYQMKVDHIKEHRSIYLDKYRLSVLENRNRKGMASKGVKTIDFAKSCNMQVSGKRTELLMMTSPAVSSGAESTAKIQSSTASIAEDDISVLTDGS